MNSVPKFAAVIAAIALALTGCTYVPVASPLGEGTCGSDPVSLAVSEDTVGNKISIDYTGPSDVSLIVSPMSFYFDFDELRESDGFQLGYQANGTDDGLVKLDPTNPKWAASSVGGGLVNWTFSGRIDELLIDVSSSWSSEALLYASTFPAVVAVSCNDTLVTGDTPDSDPSTSDTIDGLDIAVAQALYPRHSTINTVNITGQEHVVDGSDENLVIDFTFAPGTAKRFRNFDLAAGAAMIVPISIPLDSPEFPATTFDGAWWNFLMSCVDLGGQTGVFCNSGGDFSEWSFTGENEWVIPYEGEMMPGEYLGIFTLVDSADVPTQFRFAFTSFTINNDGVFAIQELPMGATPIDERLAPTGGDPNVIIWAVLGGLVLLAAVFLRPKRRNDQAESTIEPSDKKK